MVGFISRNHRGTCVACYSGTNGISVRHKSIQWFYYWDTYDTHLIIKIELKNE